jgi:hypothetical protein
MANMSYCRFENTLHDLQDCEEVLQNEEGMDKEHELPSAVRLILICRSIAEKFEGMSREEIETELKSWKNDDEDLDEEDECCECGKCENECECKD